jgi:uncharacterized membrane protein YcaP (DUF421 family)
VDSVLRAAFVYFLLLVVFRVAGQRTLAQITVFDLVLLLVIGEATNSVLAAGDPSATNLVLAVTTLVGLDVALSLAKPRLRWLERLVDGTPVVLLVDGTLLHERLPILRVDADDILAAAREAHGITRLEAIQFAVLERSGRISVVPK